MLLIKIRLGINQIFFLRAYNRLFLIAPYMSEYSDNSVAHLVYNTKEKILLFTPFAQESYAFTGKNGIFSVAGSEILYVETVEN